MLDPTILPSLLLLLPSIAVEPNPPPIEATEGLLAAPAALLVVLAGLPGPADCLIDDAAFTSAHGGCLDLATGVVWGLDSIWRTSNSALTWNNALTFCSELTDDGFSDWYLPTKAQMQAAFANDSATHLNVPMESVSLRLTEEALQEANPRRALPDRSAGDR